MRRLLILAALIVCSATLSAQAQPSESIRPFTIRIPDAVLTDLKTRLAAARFPEPLQGDGWTHGTDIRYLRQLVAYWRNGFDWRAQERRLNQLEQFTTTIDGLTVHFVHRRSKHANALPLLDHARLAGLVRGVHEDHRAAHRSGSPRRHRRRRVPRGDAVDSRASRSHRRRESPATIRRGLPRSRPS